MGLLVSFGLDTKEFTRGLKLAQRDFSALGGELKKIGGSLTSSVSLPLGAATAAVFAFSNEGRDSFRTFGETVKTALGSVGDDLAKTVDLKGIMEGLGGVVTGIADAFKGLPAPVKSATIALAAGAVVLGPLVTIGGKVITLLGSLRALFMGPLGIPILIAGGAVAAAGFIRSLAQGKPDIQEYTSELEKLAAARTKEIEALEKRQLRERLAATADPKADADALSRRQQMEMDQLRAKQALEESNARYEEYLWKVKQARLEEQGAMLRKISEEVEKNGRAYAAEAELHGDSVELMKEQLRDLENQYKRMRTAGLPADNPNVTGKMDEIVATRSSLARQGGGLSGKDAAGVDRLGKQIDTVEAHLVSFIMRMPTLAERVAGLMFDTFQQFTAGMSDSIANAIVYQQDFLTAAQNVLKQVAASIISTIIQITIQDTIASTVRKANAASTAGVEVGAAVSAGAAWTWASAVKSLGLIGLVVGAGLAAAFIASAIASSKSGASAGKGIKAELNSAAGGGIFTRPFILGDVSTGEPEIALNKRNVRDFMGLGGSERGSQTIVVEFDGQPIMRHTVKNAPAYLRLRGVTK